jgi:ceramide glucosyltransferase
MALLSAICWFVALAALAQSVLLVIQTGEHRRFLRKRQRHPPPAVSRARAAVFVPCKGLDLELEANLRPLFLQDCGNYELCFIVEAADDPAVPVINALRMEYPSVASRILTAGRSTTSGQKVHALRRATRELRADVGHLAFIDSDARPRTDWLRSLVTRLEHDPRVAAVTGYRWFIPNRVSLPLWLLYSMNAGLAVLFTHRNHKLIWGGSWAIAREVFEGLQLRECWHGTVSDDLVAARLLHECGARIEFEPAGMLASPLDASAAEAREFLRRQLVLARIYAPRWLLAYLMAALLSSAGYVAAGIVWLQGGTTWSLSSGVFLLTLLYGTAVLRGIMRRDVALRYFPDHRRRLRAAALFDVFAGPLTSLATLLAIGDSFRATSVRWRGAEYQFTLDGRLRRQAVRSPPSAPAPAAAPEEIHS